MAALERYESDLDGFAPGVDADRFLLELEPCFGEIVLHASSMPELAVSWGSVLISRAEFVRALWTRAPASVTLLLRDEHVEAVRLLHQRCKRLAARGDRLTPP